MRKSSSCPSLNSLTSSTISVHPVLYPQKHIMKPVSALPISIDSLALDIYTLRSDNIGVEIIQSVDDLDLGSGSDSDTETDKPVKISKLLKNYLVFSAPIHQVGLCMLENKPVNDDVVSSLSSMSDDEQSLGACLASPCEAEEARTFELNCSVNRNLYILSNEEKIIKRVVQLRRIRKRLNNRS